jgi:uncharacterized membrane protein
VGSASINALPVMVGMLCGSRSCGAFIATKVLVLDGSRRTPAHTQVNGHNWQVATDPALPEAVMFRGMLNSVVTLVLMASVIVVLADCAVKWIRRGWMRPRRITPASEAA